MREGVRYEIRGHLAARAAQLERQGYEIISLNIGNPGLFGFRTLETMRLAMIENLHPFGSLLQSERYIPGSRSGGDAAWRVLETVFDRLAEHLWHWGV